MASAPSVSCRQSASTDAACRRCPSKPHRTTQATGSRPGLTASISPCPRGSDGKILTVCGRTFPSSLDIGIGSISAGRQFVVPTPIVVFVRDGCRVPGDDLFPRRALRSRAGQVVARKWFREHPIDAIGPTPIMFDDLVGNLGHVWLLTLIGPLWLLTLIRPSVAFRIDDRQVRRTTG